MNSRHTTWFLVIILAASVYLGFKGLDNAWFWDDEAYASTMARNWNRTGELTAWDGRNLATYNQGAFLTEDLTNRTNPIHFYILAQSQKLFGFTTFAGRLPSVVFGIIALLLLHLILSRQFGRGSPTHLYMLALWVFATSPLLFCRTGRYYSLMLALFVGSYYLYILYVDTRHPLPLLGLAILAIAGYFTHPLIWIASYATLGLHFLLFHLRSLKTRDVIWIAIASLIVAAVCLPVLIRHHGFYSAYETTTAWYIRKPLLFWFYLRDLNLLGIFAWPIALAVTAIAAMKVIRTKNRSLDSLRPWLDWAVVGIAFLAFLCIFSKQATSTTAFADMRYGLPALPFLTIFLAAACVWLQKRHRSLGIVLAFVCTLTNVMGYLPTSRWTAKWLLPAYLREIHSPYPTAIEAVTAYLENKVKQDDVVFAFPDYESFPLMFYMGDQVKLAGILTEERPPKAEIPGNTDHLYSERALPDWIVLYGLHQDPGQLAAYFGRPRTPGSKSRVADYALETTLNVYWGNTQKPEPAAHSFSPKTNFDPKREGVFILRRVPVPPPAGTSP